MNAWILGALGADAAMVWMFLVWAIARRFNNAAWGDAGWAYAFTVVVWLYAVLGPGDVSRRIFIGSMVSVWSLRLGTHLFLRALRGGGKDARFASLRARFPKRVWFMFFAFFQLRAISVALLSAPFAIACPNSSAFPNAWEVAGAVLWLIGFAGEATADFQLDRFGRRSAGSKIVCDTGLWRTSRHPNYFFEWVVWIGYFVFAIGSPWGWITLYCPVAMLYLLTRVTGIPAVEAQSVKIRGDAYVAYQKATSPFLPRRRKHSQ